MTETDLVKVFVANDRSVATEQGKPMHGPGDSLMLPRQEAARLMALGFVGYEPPILRAPATNPAGIGLQTGHVQGPRYS